MYTGAALSFGLIRACRGGLVLYCSVLSDAGGENDGSSAIFERSLLQCETLYELNGGMLSIYAMLSQIVIKQVNIGIADDKIFPWFS